MINQRSKWNSLTQLIRRWTFRFGNFLSGQDLEFSSGNGFPCASSLSSFLFGFLISAGPCHKFPCTSSLIFSLLVDAPWESQYPAMEMSEKKVKIIMRNLSTDQGQRMARSAPCNTNFAALDEAGNRPVVSLIRRLHRVSSNKTFVVPNVALLPSLSQA